MSEKKLLVARVRMLTSFQQSPFTMTVKSIKVIDGHQNTSSYVYTDKSGSHESIKAIE